MNKVFIVSGCRTPIGRYGGILSRVRADDMAAHVLRECLKKTPQIVPEKIDEVILGCANQAGEDNRNVARMAALLAGFPVSVPGYTVNRLCASGMEAVISGARAIALGDADLVMAGGVESMTRAPFVMGKSDNAFGREQKLEDTTLGWRFINPLMQNKYGADSLTQTAENVAAAHGIDRAAQDAFGLRSQQRAVAAIQRGRFAKEIAALDIVQKKNEMLRVENDEHPRADTSLEKLSRLPSLIDGGTVTAGNCSGINDGAIALLLASESALQRYQLTPLARVGHSAAAGVLPSMMGIGPIAATEKLLHKTGESLRDYPLIEINEAFAAQVLACTRAWQLDDADERINPNGGAIALGHPLGMSGARLILSAAMDIQEKQIDRALCTLCIGLGQGLSVRLAHPDY